VLPGQRGSFDVGCPERFDRADRLGWESEVAGRNVVAQLLDRLRARDDRRDAGFCEQPAQCGVRHGLAGWHQSPEFLDEIGSTFNVGTAPPRPHVRKARVLAVTTGQPSGVERHLNDRANPFARSFFQRRKGFLVERVQQNFKHLTARGLDDHIDVGCPIDRSSINPDDACGLEPLEFLVMLRNTTVEKLSRR